MEAETPGDTLADVKVETPLSSLGDTLSKVDADTLAYTLPDVKAEAIVASLADTVEGAKRETYTNKKANVKGQDTRRNSTLKNREAKALVREWQEQ